MWARQTKRDYEEKIKQENEEKNRIEMEIALQESLKKKKRKTIFD